MLSGPRVELSAHERRTLFRIANGDARSGTHDPADVKRLQLLALIEDEGAVHSHDGARQAKGRAAGGSVTTSQAVHFGAHTGQ
jgi:hypothetical protein